MKMKTKIPITLFAVVLVSIVAYFYMQSNSPQRMVVELSGTSGTKVAGTYEADDVSYDFSGSLPTHFEVTAKRLKYKIKKLSGEGELEGTLQVDNKMIGRSNTRIPFSGVMGSYSRNETMFTVALADE
jgi:hypothetical protein